MACHGEVHFFQAEVGHDLVDNWTPAVSKQFQKNLIKTISEKTGKPYKATSINRTMATIRHVGLWLHPLRAKEGGVNLYAAVESLVQVYALLV